MDILSVLNKATERGLIAVAVMSLSALSLLTTADAFGRYVLNRPIMGSVELTELLMVVLIFSSIPLVTASKGHIAVDTFALMLPRSTIRFQEMLSQFIAFGISGLLAWVTFKKAVSVTHFGEITQMLGIPLGPFVYFMAILLLLDALFHLRHCLSACFFNKVSQHA